MKTGVASPWSINPTKQKTKLYRDPQATEWSRIWYSRLCTVCSEEHVSYQSFVSPLFSTVVFSIWDVQHTAEVDSDTVFLL